MTRLAPLTSWSTRGSVAEGVGPRRGNAPEPPVGLARAPDAAEASGTDPSSRCVSAAKRDGRPDQVVAAAFLRPRPYSRCRGCRSRRKTGPNRDSRNRSRGPKCRIVSSGTGVVGQIPNRGWRNRSHGNSRSREMATRTTSSLRR